MTQLTWLYVNEACSICYVAALICAILCISFVPETIMLLQECMLTKARSYNATLRNFTSSN